MTVAVRKAPNGKEPSIAVRELLFETVRSFLSLDMSDADIVKDENGKPCDKNGRFHFSLSHSDGFLAVLVGETPCGVDIQRITEISDGAVKKINQDTSLYRFKKERTALWALAESYVKMTGEGIKGLRRVPRFESLEIKSEFTKVSSDEDVLFEIKEISGCVLAVCVRTA